MTQKPIEQENRDDFVWDVTIVPRGKLALPGPTEIWRYRDLIWMFFKRDFIAFFKQTVLGPLWYLIQPTVTALTYYVVFGRLAKIPTDGIPPFIFYTSNIIVWSYFSYCVSNNSEVFSKNSSLFSKVYFPRIAVPISVAMSGLVTFLIQFSLLLVEVLGFWLAGGISYFNPIVFAVIPGVILYVAATALGVGFAISALTVRYRDLAYAVTFFIQIWMYASPVVYPLSKVGSTYIWLYYFNPMTLPIEAFRTIMFGNGDISVQLVVGNCAVTLLLFLVGLVLFSRAESTAMDTV